MVVADGMGGHAAGEVASRLAISALVGLALQIPDWIFWVDEEHAPEIERRTREAVQQVGSMLIERGREDAALRGMGSTLTAARSCGRDLLIVHVGDSRAYLFRAGRLERLTRDHTYAQMLVDAGQLSPGDVDPLRFSSRPDQRARWVCRGRSRSTWICCASKTAIACCSAAMGSPTASMTIRSRRRSAARSPRLKCAIELLQRALDAGGRDNITVIVATFGFPARAT